MDEKTIISGVIMDERTTISFVDVCQIQHISHDNLLEMLEHGLLGHLEKPLDQMQFNITMLRRIHSACRLQTDLGINSPGAVLALELRDELENLREELSMLRRQLTG